MDGLVFVVVLQSTTLSQRWLKSCSEGNVSEIDRSERNLVQRQRLKSVQTDSTWRDPSLVAAASLRLSETLSCTQMVKVKDHPDSALRSWLRLRFARCVFLYLEVKRYDFIFHASRVPQPDKPVAQNGHFKLEKSRIRFPDVIAHG